MLIDGKGRLSMANRQVEQMFGYARDELLGKPVEIPCPESARAMHPARCAMVFSATPRRGAWAVTVSCSASIAMAG